ncbi:MAG: ABC transporter permease [Alicyclobacillus sp.]|nr:ABC transporter permease [Alicyclobacillus sp.]
MATETPGYTPKRNFVGLLSNYGVLLALVILCIVLAAADPVFISPVNLSNLLSQISINGLLAIGQTFVILTGGIDLSDASVVGLAGVLMASLATIDGPRDPILGVIVGLAGGLAVGLFNGLVVAKLRIEPFVVTLGTLAMGQGITFVYTNGQPINDLPNSIYQLGSGTILKIPIPGLMFVAAFLISWFVLRKTLFGRRVYAIGGNEAAARMSGISVDRVKIAVYIISSVLSALAGIILAGRVDAGLPQSGQNYELDAIAAVVIGGISLSGGRGRIWGTFVGILLLGVISNGLDLLNVSPYWHSIVEGAIILVAVLMDYKSKLAR